jgi:glycosyltransferase involved in cell wall biosynthesis
LGQRVGASVWRLPGWVGEGLSRAARTWPLSRLGYAREVRAMADRLRLNIQRLNQLDTVVAPNKEVESLMVRYGVRPDRVAVVPYGVDVVHRGHCRDTWSPQLPLRIGFIGTLGYHKGCHVLLEAFRAIPAGQATLKIFGGESDFSEYVTKLRKTAENVVGVEFCGTFPNSSIVSILDNLDVLVVPSVWNENTPLVVYAAQAARCPVIGSDVPGISAAVRDGIDGILFEPGSAAALVDVIERVVRDPGVLARLSAASTAPKSVATYVDELIDIWDRRRK